MTVFPPFGRTGKFITCLISHSTKLKLSLFVDTDKAAGESSASPRSFLPFLIEYTFAK